MKIFDGNTHLKESVAGIEFKENTSDTPDVTRVRPAQFCDKQYM